MTTNEKKQNDNNLEAGKETKILRDENYRLFYADRIEFRVSPFDFKFNLITTQNLVTGGLLLVEQATLILSPQHAKQLSEILTKNVASYENEFGEINMEWVAALERVKQVAEEKAKKEKE